MAIAVHLAAWPDQGPDGERGQGNECDGHAAEALESAAPVDRPAQSAGIGLMMESKLSRNLPLAFDEEYWLHKTLY